MDDSLLSVGKSNRRNLKETDGSVLNSRNVFEQKTEEMLSPKPRTEKPRLSKAGRDSKVNAAAIMLEQQMISHQSSRIEKEYSQVIAKEELKTPVSRAELGGREYSIKEAQAQLSKAQNFSRFTFNDYDMSEPEDEIEKEEGKMA